MVGRTVGFRVTVGGIGLVVGRGVGVTGRGGGPEGETGDGVGVGRGGGVTPTYTGIAPIAVWPFMSYALTQMSARPRIVEDGSNIASLSSWLG